MNLDYHLVDVFSKRPFSGNGLTIFPNTNILDKREMQTITQEMRQFESVFFYKKSSNVFRAFIFTIEEELDFAGHPLLGLAAIVHDTSFKTCKKNEINIELNSKSVKLKTINNGSFYSAIMNQGLPEFIYSLDDAEELEFLSFLNLDIKDKLQGVKLEVISTGLPYLIIPVKSIALSKAKVAIPDLKKQLSKVGAKFVYVIDIDHKCGRTWDNKGLVEDIATGSAAGPVGAYLVKNGFEKFNSQIKISQGEFLNRKSELRVFVNRKNSTFGDILVEGDVVLIANGIVNLS